MKNGFFNLIAIRYLLLYTLVMNQCRATEGPAPTRKQYLKEYTRFPLGAAVNPDMWDKSDGYRQVSQNEFSSFTTNLHMKMAYIHPAENRFDFTKADEIVNVARSRNIRVHGHTLVWYRSVPNWMTNFKGDQQAWEAMLKNHIQTVVKYYRGKVSSWDVVNEAFEDDGSIRKTIWSEHIPDYVAKSFQWAREADPDVLTYCCSIMITATTATTQRRTRPS